MSTTENPTPPVVIPSAVIVGMNVSATTVSGRPVEGTVEELVEKAGRTYARVGGHADVLVSSIDGLWVMGSKHGTVRSVSAIVV